MRFYFFGAAATLAAAVTIGCGSQVLSSGVDIDGSFRRLIWPEATVLAGVNLQDLKKTEFYQRYSQQLDLPMLNEASTQLGFDPRRDVNQLVLESDGRRYVLLARGDLKTGEIQKKLRGMGAKFSSYRSFQLLGDERNSLALVNKSTAIGGPAVAVRSALDLSESKSGAVPGDLQTRLQAIPKGSQVWLVSSKGLPFAELPMRSDVQSALSNILAYISSTTAGLEVSSGVNLNARLTCISSAGAQRVHDALRGGIGLARLSTKDNETEMLRIYDAIEVKQKGSEVEVKADLKAGEIDKLMTYLPRVQGRLDPK